MKRPSCNPITITYHGRVNRLVCQMGMFSFQKNDTPDVLSKRIKYEAVGLFDTGATKSVISETLAKRAQLVPVGKCSVGTAAGRVTQSMHLVTFSLPNDVVVGGVEVTAAPLPGVDVLIGMDIISLGDFAISHHRGNTVFSFQIPSTHHIDFCRG